MRKVLILFSFVIICGFVFFNMGEENNSINSYTLDINNLRGGFTNTGIFNKKPDTLQAPGLEWPKGSNKFVCYSAGITLACYINGQFAMNAASYKGEYAPGYYLSGNYITNSNFKLYKVTYGDNSNTNPDWANWGLMVPYGAPWTDKNNNGIYEPLIDTPGVRGAKQTIFFCMADGDIVQHNIDEGFGGGIVNPLMKSELHMTAWAYTRNTLKDVHFIKWDIINKNNFAWDSMIVTLVNDFDIGVMNNDYVGCDTIRKMAYGYNGTMSDTVYGSTPPAYGMLLLNGLVRKNVTPNIHLGITSSVYFTNIGWSPPPCEGDPNGEPIPAYNMMKGFKKDLTWWINPLITSGTKKTKFTYPGYPETNTGWTESKGSMKNCNGDTTGTIVTSNTPSDRRFLISSGPLKINPNDTQKIIIAQFVAMGTSNTNSVLELRRLADSVRAVYNNGFNVGIQPINIEIPSSFSLGQNYPNPFNPVTKIRFDISSGFPTETFGNDGVVLKVYDATGREVQTLVDEVFQPGSYEVTFDGSGLNSGVYFYQLVAGSYKETRRMILLK